MRTSSTENTFYCDIRHLQNSCYLTFIESFIAMVLSMFESRACTLLVDVTTACHLQINKNQVTVYT